MKRMHLSSLLKGSAAALAMAFVITSCSDDSINIEDVAQSSVGASVNIINDASTLSQYVTNYNMLQPGTTRSGGIDNQGGGSYISWSMPALPASTDGMNKVECPSWKYGDLIAGNNYVAAGETLDFTGGGLGANNPCNLYIYGTLIVPSFAPAQGANIYIAPGGKLEITGESTQGYWDGNLNQYVTYTVKNGVLTNDTPTNLYIYNGAEYSGSYTSAYKTGLYVEGDVNVGNAELGGKVFVGGTLSADRLTTNNAAFQAESVEAASWTYNNDSKVSVKNDIIIADDVIINAQNVAIECGYYQVGGNFHMENNSCLTASEGIKVLGDDGCEISTSGIVVTPCLYVEKNLYIKNSATLNIARKIYCENFEASASGFAINMGGNALIQSEKNFTIQNKGWAINFVGSDADNQSAIVADEFQIMEGQAAYIQGYAFLSANKYSGKPSENTRYYLEGAEYKHYTTQETVKVTINGVKVNSKPKSCNPKFDAPDVPELPKNITVLISSINHTHDISATCMAIDGGKAYLSWHKRGTSIHGCLEALKVEDGKATLTSFMEVNDDNVEGGDNWNGNSAVSGTTETQGDFDFNHLTVAGGNVVTVGDHAKMGGFIGAIGLDANGNFGESTTLKEGFYSRQLFGKYDQPIGRSGNSVLYANDKYYIACAAGFQEYKGDITDLFIKETYAKSGSEYWKANLGSYQLTAGSAKHIAINPAGTLVATLELTGKGGASTDDYYFNDTETAISAVLKVRDADNWLTDTKWEANIGNICPIYGKNSIAMDNAGNVYVAAGKQGLVVYNNGSEVGRYSINNREKEAAAANGVAIDDKYVYVAFGKAGLYILNKSDLSIVSWYKSNAPLGYQTEANAASANYVALDGEYIYVAYGRHGVKVLKLK